MAQLVGNMFVWADVNIIKLLGFKKRNTNSILRMLKILVILSPFKIFVMPKKYHFRKMHFICTDNRVIEPEHEFVPAFQYRKYAETIRVQQQPSGRYEWEDKNKPIPKKTVEGFYLVHESLYEEILKAHDAGKK
ncbi:hypothetical protein [Pedobacter ginsengisoli]|uniref:hypothetical protein n=1 Tax=Pedobacter ginsengisoli TaxID=363852 RepID=UPI0025508AD8|nr:hypothetical protein [Pedobacter ginsengisoli]